MMRTINIYTDGSCDTASSTGGWASIISIGDEAIRIKGIQENVTHQQMELVAVINSITYLETNALLPAAIVIYSDSQYVVDLVHRSTKLKGAGFVTKKGSPIRNASFVKQLIHFIDTHNLTFVKLKSHVKGSLHQNKNREVDMLIRKELRKYLARRN